MVVVFGENVLSGEGKKRKTGQDGTVFPISNEEFFPEGLWTGEKTWSTLFPVFLPLLFPSKTGRTWGREKRYCGEQSFSRSGVKQK
jgi:hypothetical protein